MSKLNVQMTFAVIFTLAFIFYPVIGYSHPHDEFGYYGEPHGYDPVYDYGYDPVYDYNPAPQTVPQSGGVRITHPSQSFPEWERYPPTFGPENRDWPLLVAPWAPDLPDLDGNLVNSVPWAANAWQATGRAGKWFRPGSNLLGLFWSEDIGQEPLIHPMPPQWQGQIDQGWGSYAPSSSRGSRTRSSSDRSSMWDTGARIRDNQNWRESVRRRDWENTRPREDKFQRADRLNYGPRTREELNIAPGTPKDPPNQTKLNPLEN